MQFLSVPIRNAVSRVATFIFNHNRELAEEQDPESSTTSWSSKVSDETWNNTTTAATSEDADNVFEKFTHMSVTPETPMTPPPSPVADWSSTKSQYDGSDHGDLVIHDKHLMPLTSEIAYEDEEPALSPLTPEFDERPADLLDRIHQSRWFPNNPLIVPTRATTFLIPDENDVLVNTTYIKYDLNSKVPMLSATNGPSLPI
jgi:hypothetical protein